MRQRRGGKKKNRKQKNTVPHPHQPQKHRPLRTIDSKRYYKIICLIGHSAGLWYRPHRAIIYIFSSLFQRWKPLGENCDSLNRRGQFLPEIAVHRTVFTRTNPSLELWDNQSTPTSRSISNYTLKMYFISFLPLGLRS